MRIKSSSPYRQTVYMTVNNCNRARLVKYCVVLGHCWAVSWLHGHIISGIAICSAAVPTLGISQGD